MSQNSLTIANGSGATVRVAINNALDTLGSSSKGGSRPADAAAGRLWIDHDTPSSTEWTVNIFDGATDIRIGSLDALNDMFLVSGAALRGLIAGLTLSNNGLDPTNDIDIAAGQATDDGVSVVMRLGTGITKRLDGGWSAGTGGGGLDTGTKANGTWYHVWLIRRPDTGAVDALFSTSATSPTMPTNYTQKRRIGAVRTSGTGAIIPFTQFDDEFRWLAVPTDVNVSNLGTSYTNYTVSVPLGVAVEAVLQGTFTGSTTNAELYISRPGETDAAGIAVARMVSAATLAFGQIRVRTNALSQVQAKSGAASSQLTLGVVAWFDRR